MREDKRIQPRRLLVAVMILMGGGFLSGCESADPHESNLPWARPASWEGGAPGMGGGNFNAGRTGY